jgi:MerR family redox-sensitive transcriptional activator SoxR
VAHDLVLDPVGIVEAEVPARLPVAMITGRAPTQRDGARSGRGFRTELGERVAILTRMRDRLDGCVGCGCPSPWRCALYHPEDRAARRGPGPRYLLGDP